MRSVVDRNVVMRRIPIYNVVFNTILNSGKAVLLSFEMRPLLLSVGSLNPKQLLNEGRKNHC